MIERKTIQGVSKVIPIYPDPVYRSPPKQVETSITKICGSLSDIDPELNTDFEENSPYPEGVISEKCKDQISHITQNLKNWKVLKEAHIPVAVKEIQAG